MKIVIVTPYYAPAWAYGGPPRVLQSYAAGLVNLGHQVQVITTDVLDSQRSRTQHEQMLGVEVFRFRVLSNYLAYRWKLFYTPNLLPKAKAIIDQADRVLFADIRSPLNIALGKYVADQRIPYGVFAFGQIPRGAGWQAPLKWLIDKIWINEFIKRASWRFCQTEHERQMFKEWFTVSVRDTQLLVLPVDEQRRVPVRQRSKKDGKTVLFVGRFHPLKGGDVLIKAMTPILRHDPLVKLKFIGRDDGALQAWQQRVPDDLRQQVIFPGPLYGDEAMMAYAEADCFAFTPTYPEETTTAGLEALRTGTPVVVTTEAEIPGLAQYNAGYLTANRPEEIRSALKKILYASAKENRQRRSQAQKLISEKFTASVVAAQLEKYLQSAQRVGKTVRP